jgi:hypothetical protein
MKLQFICLSLLGAIPFAMAQQPLLPATQTASAPQKTISSYMGLHTFPAGNQTPAQEQQDEIACYQWAKQDAGFDPLAALTTQQQQARGAGSAEPAIPEGRGAAINGVRGAAGGAATGAVVGAIEGNPGKGAAAGAAGGAVLGRVMTRRAQRAAQQQVQQQQRQQAQQQAQAKAEMQQKLDSFKKGFSACMEGKGYVLK